MEGWIWINCIKEHYIITIIGSAPSYPLGVIDPIQDIALLANKIGCGMHVDCCLGGFVINFLSKYSTNYLDFKGVTSISADTHKNGFAPKGSSVVVMKQLPKQKGYDKNLAYYSIYSVPNWSGGVYGSPKDAGSQSCTNSLMALLAMLSMGHNGYQRTAESIHHSVLELSNVIQEFEDKLKLTAKPEVNVVSFKMDEKFGLQKGAIYAFAHEMSKRNIVLNTLSNEMVHFCVTIRFSSDPNGIAIFRQAITDSLQAVELLNNNLINNGIRFSGDAGMYCALETVIAPQSNKLSTLKYIENKLFGFRGAKDGIRAYFIALLNPFNNVFNFDEKYYY